MGDDHDGRRDRGGRRGAGQLRLPGRPRRRRSPGGRSAPGPARACGPPPRTAGLRIRFAADTHLHADFLSGAVQLAARRRRHGPGLGRRAPRVRPPRPGRRRRGRPRRADAARAGHARAHRRAPVVPAARRRAPGRGVHRRVADRRLGRPHRPARRRPRRGAGPRPVPLAAPAGRAARRRPRCGRPTAPVRSAPPRPAPRAPRPSAREKATNPLLRHRDEDTFVAQLLGSLGSYPPYFLRLAEINRRGPAVLDPATTGRLAALPASAVQRLLRRRRDRRRRPSGARLRRRAHPRRGVHPAARRSSPPGWAGSSPPTRRSSSCATPTRTPPTSCGRRVNIGYERLVGELAGGIDAWTAAGQPTASTRLVRAGRDRRARRVLDVRQDSEFAGGHLPGAVHVELGALAAAAADLPERPTVVMCGHGERAAGAASLLERAGHRDLAVLAGGARRLGRGHRPPPGDRDVTVATRAASRLGLRANLAQFSLLVAVNALVGGMLGQERTVLPLLAETEFGLTALHRRADLHPRLRRHQGRDQLRRRHAVRPLRPQTRPRRRLADRAARAAAADLGTAAGAGSSRPTCCSASTRA